MKIPSVANAKAAVGWFSFLSDDPISRLRDLLGNHQAPFNTDTFVDAYHEHLKKSIHLMKQLDQSKLDEGVKMLLQTISTVVAAYHSADHRQVNTNYMVPRETTDSLATGPAARPRFIGGRDLQSFSCFLTLEKWADEVEGLPKPGNFALPVEQADGEFISDLLFGAPTAYANQAPVFVQDTLKVYSRISNKYVQEEVRKYFDGHRERLRSFASLPVKGSADSDYAGKVVAIVNVQSNTTAVFCYYRGNQRKLQIALSPFLTILSYFLVQLHPRPGNGQKPTTKSNQGIQT